MTDQSSRSSPADTALPEGGLSDFFARTDDTALVIGTERWTRADLAAAADELAAGIAAAGIGAGDRIVLHFETQSEIILSYLACFRIGAIACPMYAHYTSSALEGLFARLSPKMYIGNASLYEKVSSFDDSILLVGARFLVGGDGSGTTRPWSELRSAARLSPKVDLDAVAVLLATSGTTGDPKLVAHSQRTLAAYASELGYRELKARQVIAYTLELAHMPGIGHLLASLHHGARLVVVLNPREPDAVLDLMAAERCTYLCAIPRLHALLTAEQRAHPRDVSQLAFAISLADACSQQTADEFEEVFGIPLRCTWSSTEAAGSLTFGLAPGNVSRLVPGTEVRLVGEDDRPVASGEVGEMLVRSDSVALGYWDGPGRWRPFEGGWFRSGDLMREGPDHGLRFEGRVKDLLVVDGDNVSPVKVENALKSHPAVSDAGVSGVSDPASGQRVVAVVEVTGDGGDTLLDDIRASAAKQLSEFEVPTMLRATAVPRTASGKVDRKALSELFEALEQQMQGSNI